MSPTGRALGQSAPAPRFLSFTTRCFARVFRFGMNPIDLTAKVENGHVEGAAVILSATTTKSLSSLAGSWSLVVHAGLDFNLKEEIQPGDWISIWWQRNDERFHGMIGNIDGVREMKRIGNGGATVVEYSLNGRDAGKILEIAEVWWNEYCDFGSNVGGKIFAGRMNYVPGGSPDAVVENLLDAFLGAEGNVGGGFRWPRGLKERFGEHFVQGLKLRFLSTKNGGKPETIDVGDGAVLTGQGVLRGELIDEISLFQPAQGTKLSTMLQQWSNPILNEMFMDLYEENDQESPVEMPKPMLFLRERPFVNTIDGAQSPWFRLPTVRLRRSEIETIDLGNNDQDRVNLIMLYARNAMMTQADQYAAYPPMMDIEDVRNHGLWKWERPIDFAGVGSNGSAVSWGQEIETWNKLIVSWYGLNHRWLNGTATTKFLLGEARIGKRLLVTGDNELDRKTAYIEGVTHQWKFPGAASTSLSLTRGFEGSDPELLAAVAAKAARFQVPPSSPPKVGA